MADEPASKRVKIDEESDYVTPATDAVTFRLLEQTNGAALAKEINAGGQAFNCEYYNQVFGEDEEIRGYEGLEVNVWLSARTYHAWVDVKCDTRLPSAPDIPEALREWFGDGLCTSRKQFEAALAASQPVPDYASMGENVVTSKLRDGSTLKVQYFRLHEAPEEIKALHERIQPMIIFEIDGANYIHSDDDEKRIDPRWGLLLACLTDRPGGAPPVVAGYCTVYRFFAYPLPPATEPATRLRLSQLLTMQPYQGLGIGSELMRAAYGLAVSQSATDLTFEDPTPALQRLRERLDLSALQRLDWLAAAAAQRAAAAAKAPSPSGAPLALSKEEAARAERESKVHRGQVRCVWEALLFLQPPLAAGKGRAALEALVRGRLESTHFDNVDRYAANKRIVDLGSKDDSEFIMFKERPGPSTAEAPSGSLNVGGRGGVNQVSAEEKETGIAALLDERYEQLEAIKRWASKKGRR